MNLDTSKDCILSAHQLYEKYLWSGGEHPQFTRESWYMGVVVKSITVQGYWDWVKTNVCQLPPVNDAEEHIVFKRSMWVEHVMLHWDHAYNAMSDGYETWVKSTMSRVSPEWYAQLLKRAQRQIEAK